MAHSFKFNTTDMSDYNLVVTSPGINLLGQLISRIQLQDRGYGFIPAKAPRSIRVECNVTGTTRANLDDNLDNIKLILTKLIPKKLTFDVLSDRYFNAMLEGFEGNYNSATSFIGALSFICPDPLGYKITEDDHDHSINAAEITVDEPVGGTGYVAPVYTLTAKNTLTGATIEVENLTTDEELVWVGDLAIDGTLVIDVVKWLVSKGAAASMSGLTSTSKFPRLKPAVTNQIRIKGLKTTDNGNLNIKYRDTYL